MIGTPVSIADVLSARDRRCDIQRELLEKYSLPVISFTMNIAGEIKRCPQADLAFINALKELEEKLCKPIEKRIIDENTGIEAFLVIDGDEFAVKAVCMELEDSTIGRLFDLDVIGRDGKKLSRAVMRKCLVCGAPVATCARSRAHGLDAIKAKTAELLAESTAELLSSYAVDALKAEAMLTPKPGLVDAHDSGSHDDMDISLMLRSAESLKGYFKTAARLGIENEGCMPELKKAGIEAEKAMLAVTDGVNTHKGAIYALGLLTAALGSVSVRGGDPFEIAAELAESGNNSEPGSHGEAVKKKYGVSGIRAEAENAFPCVKCGLAELDKSGSLLRALLRIILVCDDTTLLYRGGREGLDFTREWAKKAVEMNDADMQAYLEKMNGEMIKRRLSPGGSADMLAAAFLMNSVRGIIYGKQL